MPRVHLKRLAKLAGLVGVAVIGAALIAPGAAQAKVPNPNPAPQAQWGALVLNTGTGGAAGTAVTWSTTTACPADHQVGAYLVGFDNSGNPQQFSNTITPGAGAISSQTTFGTFGAFVAQLGAVPDTFEFSVQCVNAALDAVAFQTTYVTFAADKSWTTSATPPAGPTSTTTTVTASSPSVTDGGQDTFTATVSSASGAPAGSIEFFDGATSKGTFQVVGGSAQVQLNLTGVGTTHTIKAVFTPNDTNAFASSQGTTSVLVTGGNVQSETINVNIPQSEGLLILTVDNSAPVSLGTAVLNQTDFATFSASGTLRDVTVSDERNQTVPGWHLTGKVGDFVSQSNPNNTILGKYLGWTPNVKTQNTAGDVVAGGSVLPNNPGLSTESGLGSAPAGKGLHTSVFNAALSLLAPSSTQPGNYTATMTITLFTAP